MRVLALILFVSLPGVGQRFPGVQLIRPDPSTGRPLLVATPCAVASEAGDFTWVAPISIYEDSGVGEYVDERCLNTAAMGLSASGKYAVSLYSHYKNSDWLCKRGLPPPTSADSPEQAAARKEWQAVCKDILYRVRYLEVDARAGKYRMSNVNLLDSHGFHLSSIQGGMDWRALADLEKDPSSRGLKLTIDHITDLVRKESDYWKKGLNQSQH